MDIINLIWHSEIKYSQPCINFQKYYWLDYKPIVYSEQKMFCHLVWMNSLDWWISLGGEVIIPSEVLNHLKMTQRLFSLTPATRGETTLVLQPCMQAQLLCSGWRRRLEQLAQVIKVKHLFATIITWLLITAIIIYTYAESYTSFLI